MNIFKSINNTFFSRAKSPAPLSNNKSEALQAYCKFSPRIATRVSRQIKNKDK